MYDVITFGEAMIRLSPPHFMRLEQTHSLDVHVGGSELNIAIGVSRLGLRAAWVSKLPLNPLGYMIRDKAREQGVDTSHLVWCKEGRAGVYYVEFGSSPRASKVIYDRSHAAITTLEANEVHWDHLFQGSKLFMVSGITPALSPLCREATVESIKKAKKAGCKIVIDLNYRANLWSKEEANQCMAPLMQWTDILISTEEDMEKVLGIRGKDYKSSAIQLHEKYGFEVIAITLREDLSVRENNWTAIAYAQGQFYDTKNYHLEIVDRVGGGDSFSAGFIYGYLTGDVKKAVDYGVAFSALKHTWPGDPNWATLDEVEAQIKGSNLRISR